MLYKHLIIIIIGGWGGGILGSCSLNHSGGFSCKLYLHMPHLFFSLGISGILLSIDLTFLLTCRVWPRSYLPNRIFYPCSKYSHWYNLLFDGAGFSSGILQVDVALLQSQNCDISLIPNLKVKRKKNLPVEFTTNSSLS